MSYRPYSGAHPLSVLVFLRQQAERQKAAATQAHGYTAATASRLPHTRVKIKSSSVLRIHIQNKIITIGGREFPVPRSASA